jgi:hypothetical protein
MLRRALLLVPLLLAATTSLAQEPTAKKPSATASAITGTYSNLGYHAESGDLVGTEVFVFFAGHAGYMVLVQCSPAYPGAPVLAPATVRGSRIEFTLPPVSGSHCPSATFVGHVTAQGLRGEFNADGEVYILRRQLSYWDRRRK